jgi:hypothetical protein
MNLPGKAVAWLDSEGLSYFDVEESLSALLTEVADAARAEEREKVVAMFGKYRDSKEHNSWRAIVQRCTNPNDRVYPRYGGRGVTVCERWLESFEAFLVDVGPAPSQEHTIDRIDNACGYEPGNVRWATQQEQQRNRTNNRYLTANGQTKLIEDWAKDIGISVHTLWTRVSRGWPDDEVVNTPLRKMAQDYRRIRARGERGT